MLACEKGHEKIVQTLINNNAEVNAQDLVGRTAFMFAHAAGHEKVVQILINNNAEVNAQDLVGYTELISKPNTN